VTQSRIIFVDGFVTLAHDPQRDRTIEMQPRISGRTIRSAAKTIRRDVNY
jgi:hypothetical protein